MRAWANVLLAAVAVSTLVLAGGYWYSLNHASLQLRVDDYSLKSEHQAYDITVGSCQLREVPVTVRMSNNEWLLWRVPLPHVGGLPRQYFDFAVAIDSRACAAVALQSGVAG